MSYTVVDFTATTQNLVGLYWMPRLKMYQAAPIYGVSLYRDPSDKSSDNFLVPMTTWHMTETQKHHVSHAEKLLDTILPTYIVNDARLWAETTDWSNLNPNEGMLVVETTTGWVANTEVSA
jgi:hypothetical protein